MRAALGMVPVHLLAAGAAEIGLRWDPVGMGWSRPGLLLQSNLAGPVQHFRAAVLDSWRNKVAAHLVVEKALGLGHCWMFLAPCTFFIQVMFERERQGFDEECHGWWCLAQFSFW